MGNNLKSLGDQIFQSSGMRGEFPSLRQLQIKNLNIQPPLRTDLWVKLPKGPSGGVSRIGHEGLTLQLPHGVDLLKHRAGHVNLTSDNDPGKLLRKRHGNGADRLEIFRHILPYQAIASGSAPHKDAVSILQCHRQSIHFWLYRVFCRCTQSLIHALAELSHFSPIKHILKAFQRYRMRICGKSIQKLSADALRR